MQTGAVRVTWTAQADLARHFDKRPSQRVIRHAGSPAQSDLSAGRQFYADVKGRMEELGRSRRHMKILPACFVVVGDTAEEAQAKRAKLDSLVDYANAIASLSIALGPRRVKI